MIAWISTLFMLAACEGIYQSVAYLLALERSSTGPPFTLLLVVTIVANTIGWIISSCFGNRNVELPDHELEDTILQSIAEEGFRFMVFGTAFALLIGFSRLLGFQAIAYHVHPWIDRFGWLGMCAALVSSFAFTAIHVRKDGTTSGFMPIVPSAVFTIALINYGVCAATVLHLVYNGEALAWIAFKKRWPERRKCIQRWYTNHCTKSA